MDSHVATDRDDADQLFAGDRDELRVGGDDVKLFTAKEAAERLRDRPMTKEGRTLRIGESWNGHDIPGRGSAAKRRLRQIERGILKCDQVSEVE